jgi:manganese transport protein
LAFAGPGLMIAVGYMDPGNWATNIAGGAQFGFALLFVILLSNLFAMVLQHLALKLGIASGKDLAQACRDHYSRPVSFMLWILCELAIAACDLAEVIGSAVALNLLFHIPLSIGVLITVADVLILLLFQDRSFRLLEIIVAGLILLILGAFVYEVIVAKPAWPAVMKGFIPTAEILKNPLMLYVAIGILGATVMPHNLYLHSSIVQTRKYDLNEMGKRSAIKFATLDSTMSLLLAFVINAAILILSASAFHFTNHKDVADITDAYHLLDPVLGVSLASTLFAVALLASGQNSTLTGTLAGQIVMEGFLDLKLKPWQRRMITRLIAIVPAFIVTLLWGSQGIGKLLVLSQVILSMQLSFAVFPLVAFTSDKDKMGVYVNRPWLKYISWLIAIVIAVLNVYLLIKTFF